MLILALMGLLPMTAAQAGCRPTTLADQPPPPALSPPPADGTAPVAFAPRPAICSYVYRIQWPVLGRGAVGSVFGAERDGGTRLHAGVDIMAPKMSPIVAVRDGTVSSVHAASGDCCWITIKHDDGWSSWYLHLNNDVDGSDNGHGVGIRPGLAEGMRVTAGEVIGWVGDSGNAEPGPAHLHFELHTPWGGAIDPLASLRWGYRRLAAPALAEGPIEFAGPYIDDDGSPTEPIFALLTSVGAMTACDTWGVQVCPDLAATNLDAATWIGSLGGALVPTNLTNDGNMLIALTVAQPLACPDDGCPPQMITAGEAAAMLVWAIDQRIHDDAIASSDGADTSEESLPPAPAPYWETDGQLAWAQLVQRGLANNCAFTAPRLDALLSRATLAEMAARAFGYLPAITCGDAS